MKNKQTAAFVASKSLVVCQIQYLPNAYSMLAPAALGRIRQDYFQFPLSIGHRSMSLLNQ